MNCLLKVSVSALIAVAVSACGVLEPAPELETVTASLPAPPVAPSVKGGGNVILNSGRSGNNNPSVAVQKSAATLKTATSMPVRAIFQTDRCEALSRGGFIWFTDEVVLDDWLSPLKEDEAKRVTAQIDFSKQGALLVDFGVAGSRGVGVSVLGDKLEIKGQDALLRIGQIKPSAAKKVAQVVTHPCSLFVMPRSGFTNLVILSDMDDRLTSFENQ